ncbi:MAG: AAA family ATPase [Bacteroidota bacterium]
MRRIHILGAPGAGVSTLGRQLAASLNVPVFDTDDYYWFTDDALPYRRKRNPEHRLRLLTSDLDQAESWVLSGALCGWGDALIPRFDAVIYLWAPTDIRLARIAQREAARYGHVRIEPGGDLHTVFEKFCTWAAKYDEPSENIRSKAQEMAWLGRLECPVLRLGGGGRETVDGRRETGDG